MFWPDKPFIVIDTETTGLDFENDRVIELSIAVFHGAMYIHGFSWLLNTKRPSHPEAVKVHGITDEYRWEHGITAREAMLQTVTLMRRMRERNLPVVMFNAPFDMTMIKNECLREDVSWTEENLWVIDPLVLDRHYQKHIPVFTKPHMRLNMMAARYGVSAPTHRALEDAKTTGYVAIGQSLHHSACRRVSVMELHRSQQRWYAEWSQIFRSYATKKKFEISIPPWPFGEDHEIFDSTDGRPMVRKVTEVKSSAAEKDLTGITPSPTRQERAS